MWTIVVGFAFSICCFTRGFENDIEHYGRDNNKDEYRLLLLGKTGHGKSSLGNHLLGREAFQSSPSPNSVTRVAKKVTGAIGDTPIIVVDTPGVSDTVLDRTQTVDLIAEAVAYSPQGYDGFLIVLNPNVRITPEEKHAIKLLKQLFGDRFFNYVIFVFTQKNSFEQRTRGKNYHLKNYLRELDDEMQTFLNKAWRRHVFLDTMEDNRNQRQQTNMEFLEHLESIRDANRGKRYNDFIFEKVARVTWDYDRGRHQRYRSNDSSNENKQDEKGFFTYVKEKAKEFICFVLLWTPFYC